MVIKKLIKLSLITGNIFYTKKLDIREKNGFKIHLEILSKICKFILINETKDFFYKN